MNKQIFLAVSTALLGLSVSNAYAASLLDYQEANSAYEDAYINGTLKLNNGNVKAEDGKVLEGQTGHDANVKVDYSKVLNSADRDISIKAAATGSSIRGNVKGSQTDNTYQGSVSGSVNNYFRPNSKGAFWYGAGEYALKNDTESNFAKIGLGLGYGRVVNVTPMARALRVVEALREQGRMSGDLSTADYQKLAIIISREEQYLAEHGDRDYEQKWMSDIATILNNSGQTKGNLGAEGILRAYNVLTEERISTRKYGWLVKAGVAQVIQDYDGEKNKPGLELLAEYHRPINNQTQFSNTVNLTATLKDDDGNYNLRNKMALSREISDRIDWENSWLLDYSKAGDNADAVVSNTFESTYGYSLNNRMSFDTTFRISKTEDDIVGNGNDEIDKSLSMGITYRLK